MRGMTSLLSTERRRDRVVRSLAETQAELARSRRAVTVRHTSPGSPYAHPNSTEILTKLDEGAVVALRRHLVSQMR
jgi:hypothetical protein